MTNQVNQAIRRDKVIIEMRKARQRKDDSILTLMAMSVVVYWPIPFAFVSALIAVGIKSMM